MPENFNIQSLHGSYFTAEICFTDVVGRISVPGNDNTLYLCHANEKLPLNLNIGENFGYKNVWACDLRALDAQYVQNLKILPSTLEYHELFKLILSHRESTWDVDGSYSVLPKDVVSKIADFMDGMKILGNNQNSIK